MSIFNKELHVHVHVHTSESGAIAKKFRKLKKFMGQEFDALKARIEGMNDKLSTAVTSLATANTGITGVRGDIADLKTRLGNLQGGATAEEIATLTTIVDVADSKMGTVADGLSNLATSLTELDNETPAPGTEEPTPGTEEPTPGNQDQANG